VHEVGTDKEQATPWSIMFVSSAAESFVVILPGERLLKNANGEAVDNICGKSGKPS